MDSSRPTPQGQYPFDIEGLRQWLVAFVICNFNVDLGPEIELVYPETPFSTADLTAICFNSFPERQENEAFEDLFFHFKTANDSPDVPLRSAHEPHGSADSFYGYCVFHQEPDKLSKRKYEQKTLVLITNHSFPAFFINVLHLIAPSFLMDSIPALEAACTQIAAWKPPTPGDQQLPFLGSGIVLSSEPNKTVNSGLKLHAYAPETPWDNLITSLPSVSEIYVIYEKLLLCEPVIFLSSSPQLCSEFVSAAIDLIRPIPYAGDFRPYVTMQSTFCSSSAAGGVPRHFLIGATNPFLVSRIVSLATGKDLPAPHVVQLKPDDQVQVKPLKSRLGSRKSNSKPNFSDLPGSQQSISTVRPNTSLVKDYGMLESVQSAVNSESAATFAVDNIIRRHFTNLTASFLSPLNRYFTTLLPANSSPLTPGGTHLNYTHFALEDFLRSIDKHGAVGVSFKGRTSMSRSKTRETFYRSFCSRPGFYGWLEGKLGLERGAATAFAIAAAAEEKREKAGGWLGAEPGDEMK